MKREILRLALPSFPLQVLIGNRSRFLDRPAVLCGMNSGSGRILSLNPRARAEGIRPGMILAEAGRFCQRLAIFTPRPDLFFQANSRLREFFSGVSPLVEQTKNGFYLDLSGTARLFGPALDAADKLLQELDQRYGLVSSAGIGASKLVGGAVCSIAGLPGLAQVMPDQEANFLKPFPLRKILVRERDLSSRLSELGLELVSDLQALSISELVSGFGRDGYRLHLMAQGIDFSPVIPQESSPELEEGESLGEATNDLDQLRDLLRRFSVKLGKRLRERELRASRVRLALVYRDGKLSERSSGFQIPTAFDREIFQKAGRLLESALYRRVQVIYLGLRASHLVSGYQPDLFGETDGQARLYQALDRVRNKYGERALRFGDERCPA